MNCNWQNDAVKLPSVASTNGVTVDEDIDEDSSSNSSETHSDSASMPYQYLIERDIERERKNLRIAEALSKKGSDVTDNDDDKDEARPLNDDNFRASRSNGVVEMTTETEMSTADIDQQQREAKVPKENISSSTNVPNVEDDPFNSSTQVVGNPVEEEEDEEFDEDFELTMEEEEEEVQQQVVQEVVQREEQEVGEEEEEEDIIPEALVNNTFFNPMGIEAPLVNHYEGLLMDDVEPNDEKVSFTSSSNHLHTMNGTTTKFAQKSSLKLPKIISNEIITNDQMSPALLKVLNKSSVESNKNDISQYTKVEDSSQIYKNKNKNNPEKEKEYGTRSIIKSNGFKSNGNSSNVVQQENMRITRSNVKFYAKSNELLLPTSNGISKERSVRIQKSLVKTCNGEVGKGARSESYEGPCTTNGDDNGVSKNFSSVEGSLNKRVKINTRKLINDLTYGIKIVVERLDLSSIPR